MMQALEEGAKNVDTVIYDAHKKSADALSRIADKKSDSIDDNDKSAHIDAMKLHDAAFLEHTKALNHLHGMHNKITSAIISLHTMPKASKGANHDTDVDDAQFQRKTIEDNIKEHSEQREHHADESQWHQKQSW